MSVKAEMEKLFRRIGGDREPLVSECMDFLVYLSGSDGKITGDETGYIAEIFDRHFTPSELKAYIAENRIYSQRFERAVPLTLQRLVERDNEAFERQGGLALSLSGAYIAAYERLGREFLACDGGTSLQKIEDLSIYLGTMSGYRDRWALFPKDTPDALAAENGQRTELLLRELDALIGLGAVKQEIWSMIHLQEIQRQRRQRGLQEIFRKMCRDAGYIPAPQTLAYISGVFGGSTPGNARDVRNVFQAAVSRQADRLYGAAGLTDEELCSLEPEDVAGLTV